MSHHITHKSKKKYIQIIKHGQHIFVIFLEKICKEIPTYMIKNAIVRNLYARRTGCKIVRPVSEELMKKNENFLCRKK